MGHRLHPGKGSKQAESMLGHQPNPSIYTWGTYSILLL